jgi:lipid II:glycine glycyltransferase (peptidoglycan interpeptide bridge formation enzyme)
MEKELQQIPLFGTYIQKLHWTVEVIDDQQFFIKQFPFMGGFAKLERAYPLPNVQKVQALIKKHNIKRMVIESSERNTQEEFFSWCSQIKKMVTVLTTPYLQSKSIRIDVTPSEENIFKQFSEAKRRAVRRAIKNNVTVSERSTIRELLTIKNYSAGFLGFITTSGLKQMWKIFGTERTTSVLAFSPNPSLWARINGLVDPTDKTKELVGGIFMVFSGDIAYYWIAGASKKGKKLAAPTLLVWEALKIAKKRNCKWFDFVGVFDERFPNENLAWKGFTKFKEGFGGTTLYYPTHRSVFVNSK